MQFKRLASQAIMLGAGLLLIQGTCALPMSGEEAKSVQERSAPFLYPVVEAKINSFLHDLQEKLKGLAKPTPNSQQSEPSSPAKRAVESRETADPETADKEPRGFWQAWAEGVRSQLSKPKGILKIDPEVSKQA